MLPSRDQSGDVAALEPRIDIHHRHIGSTAIEHAQESRDAAEAGAVADAGGDGDDGTSDVAADDAGQGRFHAGDDDDGVGAANAIKPGQQALRAGDADVDDDVGGSSHPVERFAGFFGDGQIARAGGDDGDLPRDSVLSVSPATAQAERPGQLRCKQPRESVAELQSAFSGPTLVTRTRTFSSSIRSMIFEPASSTVFHFAKNDFGKAAAAAAVEVERDFAELGSRWGAGCTSARQRARETRRWSCHPRAAPPPVFPGYFGPFPHPTPPCQSDYAGENSWPYFCTPTPFTLHLLCLPASLPIPVASILPSFSAGCRMRATNVHAVYVDLGQPCEDRQAILKKAKDGGAKSARIVDAQEELCRDFAFPVLQWQAKYEAVYLLGTCIARPLICKVCLQVAREVGADAYAHGATGKGNDQCRFQLAAEALDPAIKSSLHGGWKSSATISRPDRDDCFLQRRKHSGESVCLQALQQRRKLPAHQL